MLHGGKENILRNAPSDTTMPALAVHFSWNLFYRITHVRIYKEECKANLDDCYRLFGVICIEQRLDTAKANVCL